MPPSKRSAPVRANPAEMLKHPGVKARLHLAGQKSLTNGDGPVSWNETPSTEEYMGNQYLGLIMQGHGVVKHRLLMAIPSTGTVRMEWAMARVGQGIPTNWSCVDYIQWMNGVTPMGYNVADARNMIVHVAIEQDFQWVFWVDSDVILPPNTFMKMNTYVREGDIPVVFGLYTTKSHPPEPLVYRGIGNSYFRDFQLGDKFWVDATGMGCTLMNTNVLRVMAADAPYYMCGGEYKIKRVFDTPQVSWMDPDNKNWHSYSGTEDIAFFKRMKVGNYLTKAGFPKVGRRKHQVFVDSSIFAGHISPDGIVYPLSNSW